MNLSTSYLSNKKHLNIFSWRELQVNGHENKRERKYFELLVLTQNWLDDVYTLFPNFLDSLKSERGVRYDRMETGEKG